MDNVAIDEMDVEERIKNLESKVSFLADFCKLQTSINNVLRFLVKKKFTESELNTALKEFEEIEAKLKNDEKID